MNAAGKQLEGRRLYVRLLGYVRPYARQFAGSVVAMILLALTEPAIPAMLKPLLDGTFVQKDQVYMVWMPILLVGLFLVRGLLSFASDMGIGWIGGKVVQDLRMTMFDRLLVLPTAFYDSSVTGILLARVTHNVMEVTNAATKALTVLVRDSLKVIGLLGYAFYLNWRLSLAIFIVAPPIILAVRLFARRMRRFSRDAQNAIGQLTHVAEETVQGHKVVKVFGGAAYERRRFEQVANRVRRLLYKVQAAGTANVPIVELMAATVMAGLIYAGTAMAGGEAMSVGEFVAFFTAIGLMMSPLKSLTNVSQPIQKGLAAAEHIFALIDEEAEQDTGSRDAGRLRGHVVFEDVCFRYATGAGDALRGVSFEIPAGRTVALVGPSGSGKTTVASLLPRFYTPTAGRILIDGIDIRDFTLASLRANIGLVSQDVVLFNDTVRANIAYGVVPPPGDEAVREAARAAHAQEFIERMSDDLGTPIGEDGVLLSGGQRQRIAIARALLKDAPILVLDEATSALDTESERQIQAALEALQRNRTTLVIAHRLSTIQRADEILVMQEGRIVERGTHAQLLAQGGAYADLYHKQFEDPGASAGPSVQEDIAQ
jgi:ATP-binding cassette, subfamily B, bacterial MsbA